MKKKEEKGGGGLLADPQGLGKTATATALVVSRPPPEGWKRGREGPCPLGHERPDSAAGADGPSASSGGGPAAGSGPTHRGGTLIVVPKGVVTQWFREVRTRSVDAKAGLSILLYHGRSHRQAAAVTLAGYDVVITTPGILLGEADEPRGPLFQVQWFRVILDEAHTLLKNSSTGVCRAALALKAKHPWLLTGTPIANTVRDLQAFFAFVGHQQYSDSAQFSREILVPIADGNPEGISLLKRALSVIMLRRTSTSKGADGKPLAELAPVENRTVHVQWSLDVQKRYATLEGEVLKQQAGGQLDACDAGILRMFCGTETATPCEEGGPSHPPGKVLKLIKIVRLSHGQGKKVVVISEYTTSFDISQRWLSAEGISSLRIDGSMSISDRDAVLSRFAAAPPPSAADTSPNVLFVSRLAGGVGINLQCASVLVLFEPFYTPAQEDQAVGRLRRFGQTQGVVVWRLHVPGTVEDVIASGRDKKREMTDAILDGVDCPPHVAHDDGDDDDKGDSDDDDEDDGESDVDGDVAEGETSTPAGERPGPSNQRRTLASVRVHTAHEGEETLVAMRRQETAGPCIHYIYLRLSNKPPTPRETISALLAQVALLVRALFPGVRVGDVNAPPSPRIEVYADVGMSASKKLPVYWTGFQNMVKNIKRRIEKGDSRPRVCVSVADISRIGRRPGAAVTCVKQCLESGANEVLVTYDRTRQNDLQPLGDSFDIEPLVSAAVALAHDSANRPVARARLDAEASYSLQTRVPSPTVKAAAQVLAALYLTWTKNYSTYQPVLLLFSRASPTCERGRGSCAVQEIRMWPLVEAVVEAYNTRTTGPPMVIDRLRVWGDKAHSGAYPGGTCRTAHLLREALGKYEDPVVIVPMAVSIDRFSRDEDTIRQVARLAPTPKGWVAPPTVLSTPDSLLRDGRCATNVPREAERLASFVANGANGVDHSQLTKVLTTALQKDDRREDRNPHDKAMVPVALTDKTIKAPWLRGEMRNAKLTAHGLTSIRPLAPHPRDTLLTTTLLQDGVEDGLVAAIKTVFPYLNNLNVQVWEHKRERPTALPPLQGDELAPPARGRAREPLDALIAGTLDLHPAAPTDTPTVDGLVERGDRASPPEARPPDAPGIPCEVCEGRTDRSLRAKCGTSRATRDCERFPECPRPQPTSSP